MLFWMSAATAFALSQEVPIIYPKEHALVYDKVNLVLDPTDIPFFQALVGATEYPIVDTSAGRHAYQGLALKPGVNTLTVRVFALSPDPNSEELVLINSREISVFSRVGLFTRGTIPPGYKEMFFHTRERELSCSGCHALEVDRNAAANPNDSEEMICSGCHRTLPVGNNVHYPAAVWNCIACHDPNLYPVKYQFTRHDPWKMTRNKLPVKPAVIAVPAAELFEPCTDALASKNKVKKHVADIVNYLKRNPEDKVRLEVHADNMGIKDGGKDPDPSLRGMRASSAKKKSVKNNAFPDSRALSDARAKKLAAILREAGIEEGRFAVAGAVAAAGGSSATASGQDDDRVEIVYYPSGSAVTSNASLPELKDRERIMVKLDYVQGQEVTGLKVLAKLPSGKQYVAGSGLLAGRPKEPAIAGEDLVWEIGNRGANFSEKLSYVLKSGKGSSPEDPEIRIAYASGGNEISRDFLQTAPAKNTRILEEMCKKCHKGKNDGKFGHEPAATGSCNICHNPHASSAPSLLREPSWLLCTHCHTDKSSGVHVLVGIVGGSSHPTKGIRDPSQPDKQFSCVSCHNPHSANSKTLFARNTGTFTELCQLCHQK